MSRHEIFMAAWIASPPAFRDPSAMPALGVSADEARTIALYLAELR